MSKKNIDFKLYLITDNKLITRHSSLISVVRKALKGGVKAVQLREKNLETLELLKIANKMSDVTKQFNASFFINDRFDIALAVGADGVHLTQNSIPASAVRKAVKKKLLIGVSTHSLKEAREAEKGGADFITVGPVYRTPSKLKYGKPIGLDTLQKITSSVSLPVFAIGGVKSSNIKFIKEAGAYGAAMIREVLASNNINRKTRELVNLLGA
jgi:thiamine-phosphate pyrophosphorylase